MTLSPRLRFAIVALSLPLALPVIFMVSGLIIGLFRSWQELFQAAAFAGFLVFSVAVFSLLFCRFVFGRWPQ